MNLENEMYRVMAVFCSGGIPIDFKGAMVLHAFLYENGLTETAIRPTRDIDANWLSAVSTGKVFQRIKDILDLYYLSQCFRMDSPKIKRVLRQTNSPLQSFDEFRNNVSDLEHACDKFRFVGNAEKPSFHHVYTSVTKYISDFLPKKPQNQKRRCRAVPRNRP